MSDTELDELTQLIDEILEQELPSKLLEDDELIEALKQTLHNKNIPVGKDSLTIFAAGVNYGSKKLDAVTTIEDRFFDSRYVIKKLRNELIAAIKDFDKSDISNEQLKNRFERLKKIVGSAKIKHFPAKNTE